MWSSPDDYYAWQTLIYLGLFSFTMSWVAQLAVGEGLTVDIIATCGWIFFCPGHWVAAGRSQDPLFWYSRRSLGHRGDRLSVFL